MSSPTAQNEFTPPLQSSARRWGEVLLILLIFFVAAGDPPPSVNEAHYLGRLKHFWNPNWCRGDLFLESADTQLLFIGLFGWVTRFISLTATAWVGRVLAWTMLAWAWQRLSWRLVPLPLAAVLSAALFITLINLANLAGEWVLGGVEAKCFAYGFVLLALRDLIDARWNRLWILLGGACALHPLVGGWSAVICAGVWLIEDRRRVAVSAMVPGLVGGALLALIGVVPALLLTWNEQAEVISRANVIYVFKRLPHHLALLHLPEREVAARLVRHGVLLGALVLMMGVLSHRKSQNANRKLQIDAIGLRRIALFAGGAVLIAIIGFAIELALWNHPETAARLLKYYWFRLTDIAAALAVALYSVAIIVDGLQRRRRWSVWLLGAVLAFALWHLITISAARYSDPIPPADRKMVNFTAWAEACEWIAKNAPADALFLTPRMASSFKWRTGRPEVVTYKDIPQDASSIIEWNRRLRDIFYIESPGGEFEVIKSLAYLPNARIEEIVDRYDIEYIIVEGDLRLSFPIVYPINDAANAEYVIYKVGGRNAGDRQ